MPSPVTAADFVRHTQLVGVCEKLAYLMGAADKTGEFIGNLYDEDGNPTQELLSLGQPPPGVVVAWWTTTSDFTTAKTEVEKMGRTAADIAAGNAPFWRVADGTNGTPDLRGRFILGVQNVGSDTSTARGVNSRGGAETVTLGEEHTPSHNHNISGTYQAAGSDDGSGAVDSGSSGGSTPIDQAPLAMQLTEEDFGGDAEGVTVAHENLPPFHVLYWIIRTTRTA